MPDIHPDKISSDPEVNCAECMKKMPLSAAYDPDDMDYDESFCARECFEAWNRKMARERERSAGGTEDAAQ